MLSELLIQEAAANTRQAPSTIRRKIPDGELQAARVGAGSRRPLRVPRAELERYLFPTPASAPEPTTQEEANHE
jgi:excisionase family DNA binding protein